MQTQASITCDRRQAALLLAAATLCERAAHAAVDTLQEAPLTLADVTPPVVPAQPLSQRQVLFTCTLVCVKGNGTGAQPLRLVVAVYTGSRLSSASLRGTHIA